MASYSVDSLEPRGLANLKHDIETCLLDISSSNFPSQISKFLEKCAAFFPPTVAISSSNCNTFILLFPISPFKNIALKWLTYLYLSTKLVLFPCWSLQAVSPSLKASSGVTHIIQNMFTLHVHWQLNNVQYTNFIFVILELLLIATTFFSFYF